MVRYAKRPWFTPLGFMASSPTSYAPMLVFISLCALWPFRYHLSEFFERQKDGPHVELRQKAVSYYSEMERMHRRQAMVNQENLQDDNAPHRLSAQMSIEAIRQGRTDQEYDYWYAHQRDTIRAEKLLGEVRELKQKLGIQNAS